MRRSIKYLFLLVASLVALLAMSVFFVNRSVEQRLARTYEFPIEPIEVPSDAAAIERGRHLVTTIFFCQECHGEDLAGKPHFSDPLSGTVSAKNLTAGAGGLGGKFSDADWVRVIRHGVDEDGHPLIEMPSNSYYYIGDADLGAIIAFLKSLPPVDNELPKRDLGLFYQLAILSDPSLIPAEVIDHTAPRPPAPEPAVSAEYGKYLATACTICHGPDLSGGTAAGAGLDLTGGGNLTEWTEAEFMHALRTGERPRGEDIDPSRMPWKRVGKLTDDELRAIWMYLQTLQ
jgi:mono/diheme cytochrome c family protein